MKAMIYVIATSLLVGCGGGGGGTASPSAEATVKISGTAATGAAMDSATITFKCQKGTYFTSASAKGSYVLTIPSAQFPCLVRAATASVQLHSIAVATNQTTSTVNITPVSELVITELLHADPTTEFDSNRIPAKDVSSPTLVGKASDTVVIALTALDSMGALDPIGHVFEVGDEYDKKLDRLQSSLSKRSLGLGTIRQAFIEPGSASTTRFEQLTAIIQAADGNQVTREFLAFAAQWSVAKIASSSSEAFGFYLAKTVDSKIISQHYQLSADLRTYSTPFEPEGTNNHLVLTDSGIWGQVSNLGIPISNMSVTSSSPLSPYIARLGTVNKGTAMGRWEFFATTYDVAGQDTSNEFDPAYLNNRKGVFPAGSKLYHGTLKNLESEQFLSNRKLEEGAASMALFTQKYSSQPLCDPSIVRMSNGSRYSGAMYAVRFIADSSRAQLVPADKNCIQEDDGFAPLELTWEYIKIGNQNAIELTGAKLPPYFVTTGDIAGMYDSAEANPSMRYGTDKYRLIVVRNDDGTFSLGARAIPRAQILIRPGIGNFLNSVALNSLLQLVDYPPFSLP